MTNMRMYMMMVFFANNIELFIYNIYKLISFKPKSTYSKTG